MSDGDPKRPSSISLAEHAEHKHNNPAATGRKRFPDHAIVALCGNDPFRSRLSSGVAKMRECERLQVVNKRVLVIYREANRLTPYRDALLAAGINPVMREANRALSLSDIGGLVLTGGSDVDPKLYGETRHPETEPPDGER